MRTGPQQPLIQITAQATRWWHEARMDERAQILRRRIELYRGYLRDGVASDLATQYLRQIAEDEAELAKIEPEKRRRT